MPGVVQPYNVSTLGCDEKSCRAHTALEGSDFIERHYKVVKLDSRDQISLSGTVQSR